jgi:arsenate reductase
MAEAFLKSFNKDMEVYSAGTQPSNAVNPFAIKVMKETGIDIGKNKTKDVKEFLSREFDYVITVCDDANESCPVFTGKVKKRLHIGFSDPATAKGTEDEILNVFREVRDTIKEEFFKFYIKVIKPNI